MLGWICTGPMSIPIESIPEMNPLIMLMIQLMACLISPTMPFHTPEMSEPNPENALPIAPAMVWKKLPRLLNRPREGRWATPGHGKQAAVTCEKTELAQNRRKRLQKQANHLQRAAHRGRHPTNRKIQSPAVSTIHPQLELRYTGRQVHSHC